MNIDQGEVLQERVIETIDVPQSSIIGRAVEVVPCAEPETDEARLRREAREARLAQEAREADLQFYYRGVSDYRSGHRETKAAQNYIAFASVRP